MPSVRDQSNQATSHSAGSRPDANADQRIAKLLARAGVASRREVERMIAEGRVALNGEVILTPATIIASLEGVTVDGEPVEAPAPARLFLYHKPAGLLVTERDPGGRPTIYDRLPVGLPRVVPVGRLDLGTEGLLLLTTDGGLKRQLELPATGVQRAYRARAYGDVTQSALETLIEGVTVEGVRYGSIDANLERRTGANVWIEMVLTEGKNREVRRVLEYLGLQVSRLIRTRYGPFALGELMPGEVAEVRGHDIASFRKNPTRLDLPQPARQRGGARADPVKATTIPVIATQPGRPPKMVPAEPTRGGPARALPGRNAAPRTQEAVPSMTRGQRGAGAAHPRDRRPDTASPAPGQRQGVGQPMRVARNDIRPDTSRAADHSRPASERPSGRNTVATPRPGGPSRGSPRHDRQPDPQPGPRGGASSRALVTQPARAARARKFRETRAPVVSGSTPRDGAASPRSGDEHRSSGRRPAGRTGGPALGRGSPPRAPAPGKSPRGGGKPRPPRTRG